MPTDNKRMPTLYIPHGGGPCFFMDTRPGRPADLWDGMAAYLRRIAANLLAETGRQPKAILVISGHWETAVPTVHVAEKHTLYYDYYGFPEHTYHLQYPASGSPALAARVKELLQAAEVPVAEEKERGLDHGVFIPFMLIYPEADIPIVQLSLHHSLDAGLHVALGQLLAPLRDEDVLIVGSGMSYHNLRAFFTEQRLLDQDAKDFDDWLAATIAAPEDERNQRLAEWDSAPGALACHPRSEHLIPLMVAAGAAEADLGRITFNEALAGKMISGVQFG